jgi:2-polyprenyl-3-methyl-5-hydroxy-6-metoxy-1,4-benzoquinol methylase
VIAVVVPSRDHVRRSPDQAPPHVSGNHSLLAHHARRLITLHTIFGTNQGYGIGSRQGHIVPAVSEADRRRWDERHTEAGPASGDPGPPSVFASIEDLFPVEGSALEIASGRGELSIWLALRGMEVQGVDISPVAIEFARELAQRSGVADQCRFDVWDLDEGLPPGPPMDLVVCHMYREPRLDRDLIERLAPRGLLAIASLSEVGGEPGRFRARPGELREAFAELDLLAEGESDGVTWLLGRKSG